ncbi:protein-glutamate O-methyltransferase CheR [Neobacillus sp.]|uniref:CheR family methyltransferase n=1 Tax=Neobacillus sp. TaxID=2675273 RepID=UPI002898B3CC|nr:protein-glutamate O-methyltransferase CheR [Neobacillus sp.]
MIHKWMELALKIKEFCGIDFTMNLAGLDLKVSRRLNELGLILEEYTPHLQKDPKEWDKLVEHITINETYFFREFNQLEEFQNLIKKQSGKLINVWCVPCSTGEEAYSLAILAKELEASSGNRVRIVASDINKKVLEHAKKGFYSKNSLSFRRLPDNKEYLKKYFIETDIGYEVKNEIKQMVSFEPFNLTDYSSYAKYNQIDFIFCRNVLFYFNEAIIKEVIRSFHGTLSNDGYLFLGHAESISSFESKFVSVHTKDTYYYKKDIL